jgi:hypothetical protein
MPDNQQIAKAQIQAGSVTMRQDLAEEITIGHEKSIAASAAAAKAEIEARVLTAKRWPRDVDVFREGILKDCRRPGFAEIALFRKPVAGKEIVDFSIRFVESALQHYTNTHSYSDIEYEDAEQAKLRVTVLDVQRNSGVSHVAILDKVVERKQVKAGRKIRGMRENSYGDMVYLVEATPDEFRNLRNAETSKLLRDLGKRLLPRDILDECRELIDRTLADENAKDPDSAKKKVLDKFAGLGVSAAMLKEYLGRPVETLTAKDLAELATLHNGLKGGDFTWAEVMRTHDEPAEGESKPAEGAPATRTRARDKIMGQASFTEPQAPEKPPEKK